jgi:hypothetical protein
MDRSDVVCFRRRPLETVNAVLEDTKLLFCLRSTADTGALNAADFCTEERNIILVLRSERRCELVAKYCTVLPQRLTW